MCTRVCNTHMWQKIYNFKGNPSSDWGKLSFELMDQSVAPRCKSLQIFAQKNTLLSVVRHSTQIRGKVFSVKVLVLGNVWVTKWLFLKLVFCVLLREAAGCWTAQWAEARRAGMRRGCTDLPTPDPTPHL